MDWKAGTAGNELTAPLVANSEFWHYAAQNEDAPQVRRAGRTTFPRRKWAIARMKRPMLNSSRIVELEPVHQTVGWQ